MTQVLDHTSPADRSTLRNPAADGILVGLAGLHGVLLLLWPGMLLVGLGLWWNANTISHYFIHRPFFRSATANAAFSVFLSLLLGLPQSVWRDRHLAHHAGTEPRIRRTPQLWIEVAAVGTLWLLILVWSPWFFLLAWLPGLAIGLSICAVHGHFEHIDTGTTSHYGRIYNYLFFNDGYHVEHHEHPACDWRRLQQKRDAHRDGSRWPAVLRWLEHPLETLERLVLPRPGLQRFVLDTHRQAWLQLTPELDGVRTIGIVGGGLFPRTATLLRELLPHARLTIIDGNADNVELARQRLGDSVQYDGSWFDPKKNGGFDLLVFPLDYRGEDREALREHLPSPTVVFHEWIWNPRGESAIVSPWLLKRLNLMRAS